MEALTYTVKSIRDAGLEVKWSKNKNGTPIMVARAKPGPYYYIDKDLWKRAKKVGIREAFSEHTLLGDIFFISI